MSDMNRGRKDERRRAKRYNAEYPLEFSSSTEARRLDLRDVSRNGLAFLSSQEFNPKNDVELELFLKKKRFTLKARVVNSVPVSDHEYRTGVRFLSIPEEFRSQLDNEIEEIKQFHRELRKNGDRNASFEQAFRRFIEHGLF